jgi:hypothetical protein
MTKFRTLYIVDGNPPKEQKCLTLKQMNTVFDFLEKKAVKEIHSIKSDIISVLGEKHNSKNKKWEIVRHFTVTTKPQ